MKKITSIIFIFVVSLVLLAGCTKTDNTKTPSSGFIGGTNGLVATFIPDAPPAKVYDANTYPFTISLQLENKGEYAVKANEVIATIDSIDYSTFQISNPNQKNPASLEGARRDAAGKSIMPGGKSVDISYDANYKSSVPASQPFKIGMNLCYLYQTNSISKACLRKDITARSLPNDVCKIEDKRLVSSSGAPVQVTSMSERPSGKNQIEIVVEIENKNVKGEVYEPNYLSKGTCITDPSTNVQNKLKAKIFFEDNQPSIKCAKFDNKNEGTLKLIANKATFNCLIDTSVLQATTFEKPIRVQLDYVYKDYTSQSIIVDRSL